MPRKTEFARGGADLHHEAVSITGDGHEVVMFVEGGSLVVDSVDHDELAAGPPRDVDDPRERVHEQLSSQATSLRAPIQRELCQQNGRDLARRAPADTRGEPIALHEMRRDREVTHERARLRIDKYVGPRSLTGGALRVLLEPIVERRLPA